MEKVLYHYTSRYHLPMIMKSGFLQLTESNLIEAKTYKEAMPKELSQLYKPVVWLTTTKTAQGNGLEKSMLNKYEIRITLRKREHYENWVLWSKNNRIKSSWAKRLSSVGNPNSWYVSEKIIPLTAEEVLRIENTITGEIIIDVENGIRNYTQQVEKPTSIPMYAYKQFLNNRVELGEIIEFHI